MIVLPGGAHATLNEAAPQDIPYTVQFWSERADYDEANVGSIGDKYEYIGLKNFTGAEGHVPDLLTVDPSGVQFPDIELATSSNPELFAKLYHLNAEYTKAQNTHDDAGVRPLNATKKNVYNVFFDREVYEVVFEKDNHSKDNTFDPVISKNGTTYDAKANPYTLRLRFGQAFGDAWPFDKDIMEVPVQGKRGYGLTGWEVMNAQSKWNYVDTPPYRLTYSEFVQYAGQIKASISRPGVSYTDRTIAMGITDSRNTHPVFVDFALEGFEDGLQPREFPVDEALSYWKSDTTYIGYSFPVPQLQGFERVATTKRQQVVKSQAALDKINAARGDATPLTFIDTLYGTKRATNGYLRLEYKRQKFSLFLDADPRVPKADSDYSAENTLTVPYGMPTADLNLPTPTKPSDLGDEFVFRGWAWDSAGASLLAESSRAMPNYNVAIHAFWDVERHVVFNLDGGAVDGSTDQINRTQFDGQAVEFPTPTRDGYTFIGWADDNTEGKTYKSTDKPKVDGNMSFTAKWDQHPDLQVKDASVAAGDDFDVKSLVVKAEDVEDGVLTDQVKLVDDGGLDVSKPGKYTVTFEVVDSAGAKATKSAVVTVNMKMVALNEVPSLEVKDASVAAGDDFDVKSLVVKAEDVEDGVLTDQVKLVDDGGLDVSKPGKYTVTFEVVDSAGAKATKSAVVTVNMKMVALNEVPSLEVKDASVAAGDDFDVKSLVVKAEDVEDGVLTDQVKLVDDGGLDVSKPGKYTVTFEVVDSAGAKATKSAVVTVNMKMVALNEVPSLEVKDASVAAGDDFDVKSLVVKAEDVEDGVLTDQVKLVDDGGLDVSKPGKYTVTFEVVDSAGAKATKSAVVTVNMKMVALNEVPSLEVKDASVAAGDDFDVKSLVVKAEDVEDGVLTDQVKLVDDGGLDVSKPGKYTVTFEVVDSAGAKATKSAVVTVNMKMVALNEVPSLEVKDASVAAGDDFDVKSLVVKAEDVEDGVLTDQVKLVDDGGLDVSKPGKYTVTFEVVDSAGAKATKSAVVTVNMKMVALNEVPSLEVKDASVAAGDDFDVKSLVVKAEDVEDGVLTDQVKLVDDGGLDVSKPGKYTVTFEVVDSAGAKATKSAVVTVNMKMVALNEVPSLEVKDASVAAGDDFDVKSLVVKAEDVEDGVLTDQVKLVDDGGLDVSKPGKYTVTFEVVDSAGAKATKSAVVTVNMKMVALNEVPSLEVKDASVAAGDDFDVKSLVVKAEDVEDGVLTDQVKLVDDGGLDVSKPGKYTVTFEVVDSAGAKATKSAVVTVNMKMVALNEVPSLEVKDASVAAGDDFDVKSLVVKAEDVEDGVLTDQVKLVDDGGLDVSKPGKYTVTFEVVDSAGAKATKSAVVTVNMKMVALNEVPSLEVKDASVAAGDDFDVKSLVVKAEDVEDGVLTDQVKLVDDGGLDVSKPGKYTVTFEVVDSAGAKATKSAVVTVNMKMVALNEVPSLEVKDASVAAGDDFDVKSLVVKAEDVEDGVLTDQVKLVDDGGLDVSKPGKYTVTFEVVDSAGAKATKSAVVTVNMKMVALNEVPSLEVKDASVAAGDDFDVKSLVVKAEDVEDGVLTDQVKLVDDGGLDVSKPGKYTVTFEVVDSAGAKATKSAVVTVNMKMVALNEVPSLEVKDASVAAGDDFDVKSLVVKAEDVEDGVLTDQVKLVDDGGLDVSKPGKYTVTFEVVDSAGAKATKSAVVTVNMKMVALNEVPSLEVKDASVAAGDDFDVKSLVVKAEDVEDGVLTDQVKLVDDGGLDVSKPGKYTVTFEVVDSAGAKATKSAVVTVLAKEAPAPGEPTGNQSVNPAPQATPHPSTQPSASAGKLAWTGADSRNLATFAGAMLLMGAALVATRRRVK
ncbi:immunoglobulin-like domain-containing protein [Trueperella abortisuis]|uniref:Repeat protein (TIGR02543 family) n=1 Tax=Trueperella abortisuis TaxID=445930 RepID=A0ABT9PIB4_9ACTO|nr:immunoglobulin-like domain-containing protein [Trueperella abortisuis]MDP9831695.1 putative repeat protein (TIGR02543 family) [Trueperella abortisuis]